MKAPHAIALTLLTFVTGCNRMKSTANTGSPEMMVLANICNALRAMEAGQTNNAHLILQSTLDGEIRRLAGNNAPRRLSEVYANNPDFAVVQRYRLRSTNSASDKRFDSQIREVLQDKK